MPTFNNDPVESSTDSTSAAIVAENTNSSPSAGVGVHAKSAAAGVLGESSTWHGVAGITQSKTGGAGVFGAGDTGGPGVIGTSKTWVGVFGEGNPAGLFHGDVNVSGALNVQGSNVLQRIGAIEQATGTAQLGTRISALEQKNVELQTRLNNLQNQVNTAVSNLTGRVTIAETLISDLKARVTALGG